MLLKCKMCGGDIEVRNNQSIATCQYCGSIITVPVISDEQIARRYNDANRLRQENQFDAAYSVYEEIIAAHPKDAEAYWGALLCHLGIEYVFDPHSEQYKPTFHKTSIHSVFDDDRYLSAIQYADTVSRKRYEEEANEIERIRELYFEISNSKEPYDIFISYKQNETNSGKTTKDFEIAESLYGRLTSMGYRVFFSHVSLEEVVGESYEPVIFAALQSAKIMLAIGTSKEHYYSEWVKNEWQRYIQIKKIDNDKLLIPVFSDMLPSDLPMEFSALQAVDYAKVGALEDLLHFIENRVPNSHGIAKDQELLLERAIALMQQGDFGEATFQYLDNALNINPQSSAIYLYRLQREFKICDPNALETLPIIPDDHPEWKKALYTASIQQTKEYKVLHYRIMYSLALRCAIGTPVENAGTLSSLEEKLRERLVDSTDDHYCIMNYQRALETLNKINEEGNEPIANLSDTINVIQQLLMRAQKEESYRIALGYIRNVGTTEGYLRAKKKLETILEYRDAKQLVEQCERNIPGRNEEMSRKAIEEAGKSKLKTRKQCIDAAKHYIEEIDQPGALNGLANCMKKYKESKDRGDKKQSSWIYTVFGIGAGLVGGVVVMLATGLIRIVFHDFLAGVPVWAIYGGLAVVGAFLFPLMMKNDSSGTSDHAPVSLNLSKQDQESYNLLVKYRNADKLAEWFGSELSKYDDTAHSISLKEAPVCDVADCIYLLRKKKLEDKFAADVVPKAWDIEELIDYANRKKSSEDAKKLEADRDMAYAENIISDCINKGNTYSNNVVFGSKLDMREFERRIDLIKVSELKAFATKLAQAEVYQKYNQYICERKYKDILEILESGSYLITNKQMTDNLGIIIGHM